MNRKNLEELLHRYENNLDFLNNIPRQEVFKWQAVQHFQNVWFSKEAKNLSFADKFAQATARCSVLLDTGKTFPRTGMIDVAEKEPDQVAHLFEDVLFAQDGGDLSLRQAHMEEFVEGINALHQKHFPQNAMSRQSIRFASVYLALYAPDDNYIYQHTPSEHFATCIEYGVDIGSGSRFQLSAYYGMCDLVAEAISHQETLVTNHQDYRKDSCYPDENHHLMVFDLFHCTQKYNLAEGLDNMPKRESIHQHTMEQQTRQKQDEQEKFRNILLAEKQSLEAENNRFHMESLLQQSLTHKSFGIGTINKLESNIISVSFSGSAKLFNLDKTLVDFFPTTKNRELMSILIPYLENLDRISEKETQLNNL